MAVPRKYNRKQQTMTSNIVSAHIQRNWIPAHGHGSATDTKLESEVSDKVKDKDKVKVGDGGAVTVASYNILASIHIKPRGYPYCPTGFRETMERHPQLMVELCHHSDADIFCFQEVETDYFHQTLLPELRELGYDGVHHQKALGIREGVATFYRPNRFTLERPTASHFKDLIAESLKEEQLDAILQESVRQRAEYESPMLITTFRCRRTGQPLTVTNVHLVWQTLIVPDLNTLQACIVMRETKESSSPGSASILCGDFNHSPTMPGYQVMRDGRLDNQSLQHLRKFPLPGTKSADREKRCLVDVLPQWFCHSCSNMKSSYAAVQGEEPAYTTYMDDLGLPWVEAYRAQGKLDGLIQEEESESESSMSPRHFPLRVMDPALNASLSLTPPSKVCPLDYIWFSSDRLRCLGVEGVIGRGVLLPFWACPNQVFPSDHFLIKAAFSFI